MKRIETYVDGGCKGNGKETSKGGYAYIVLEKNEILYEDSKIFEGVTNNQMEILGISRSLESLIETNLYKEEVILHTDSQYCVNGINEWIIGWKKNGWKTGKKEPVKNKELWMELDDKVQKFPNLKISWVKGHADSKWNNYVDELYNKTISGTNYKLNKEKVNPKELAIEFAEWLIDNGIVDYVSFRSISGRFDDFKKYKDGK